MYPIVGGRKVEHLKGNIEALALRLDDEELDKIDNAYGFEMGFPHEFLSPHEGAFDKPFKELKEHRK